MRPLSMLVLLSASLMPLSNEPQLVSLDDLLRIPILPRKLGQVRFRPLVST